MELARIELAVAVARIFSTTLKMMRTRTAMQLAKAARLSKRTVYAVLSPEPLV